jgi:hypothetical protein
MSGANCMRLAVCFSVLLIEGCAATKQYTTKMDDTTYRVGISVCSGADDDGVTDKLIYMANVACGGTDNIRKIGIPTVSGGENSSTMCPGGWVRHESLASCKAKPRL